MKIGQCKNCANWDRSNYFISEDKANPNIRPCNKAVDVSDDGIIKVDGFGSSDYEGYMSTIYTGAEFGCILFEEDKHD